MLQLHRLSITRPGDTFWCQVADSDEKKLCALFKFDSVRHDENHVLSFGKLPDKRGECALSWQDSRGILLTIDRISRVSRFPYRCKNIFQDLPILYLSRSHFQTTLPWQGRCH